MASKTPRKPSHSKGKKSPKGQKNKRETAKKGGQHRFKPGESGNPRGRPLGTTTFKAAYESISKLMTEPVKINGEVRMLTGKEQIAARRMAIAMKGRLNLNATQRAMDSIENRIDGLPVQAIKNVGDGTGKVAITINRVSPKPETVEVKTERTDPTETDKKE